MMSPSRRYRREPLIADGMIDGSVDPTASSGVAPRARIAGVETTAPPTPNIPDSTPVATPTTSVRIVCHGSDTACRRSGRTAARLCRAVPSGAR